MIVSYSDKLISYPNKNFLTYLRLSQITFSYLYPDSYITVLISTQITLITMYQLLCYTVWKTNINGVMSKYIAKDDSDWSYRFQALEQLNVRKPTIPILLRLRGVVCETMLGISIRLKELRV